MKYLVRRGEMKQYDTNTQEVFGIPSLVLIERAALAAVEELERDGLTRGSRILLACGAGNNGADGLVMARLLHLKGHAVQILTVGSRTGATPENQKELEIAANYGVEIMTAEKFLDQLQPHDHEKEGINDACLRSRYDVVVDAVFGVGLSRRIEGVYGQLITCLNELTGKKVAVDIPSGINADNGSVLGVAFRADLTVTFSYEKIGMRLFPGQSYCGHIVCRSVGIDDRSFLAHTGRGRVPAMAACTPEDLALIPARRPHTNKGSYGKVLVIAGSVNMAGAALFSARAAYLSGCGLVRILTPEENRTVIQSTLPEAVLTTYHSKKPELDAAIAAMQWADVIVCGPGIGTTDAARRMVHAVLKNAAVPVIMDADALNIISEEPDILRRPHTDLVITPHLGEMARLQGVTVSYIQDHLVESAEEFARTYNLICVLKDARTITAVPYERTYVNLSGNNGMATGGSGDVLTGVIAGLIAQGAKPEQAAPLGVYIHGLAGDEASKRYGRYSLMAQMILEKLPDVFLLKDTEQFRKEGIK